MLDLDVIDAPAAAALALEPIKARLLAELATPASAAALAGRVGLTRQKVNYHLRALEEHKLIEPAEERRWGGLTERLMVATATSYVVSPAALGPIAADPGRSNDRLSASYLVALAARMIREVGSLLRKARQQDKRLATLSIDTVIKFRSPTERTAFTADLAQAVTALAARYHDESTPAARPHRLIIASYPAPNDVTEGNGDPDDTNS
ncbi:helix-turn-helix domain-containing protein [Ensifer adhaerens]|uniref:helix-turn-helix domain-containing protein n=1 Tax=Ensifer adhaerens TaxID=106592 RepID=UPI000CF07B21|nr:helix-turn-helix domain-containing protein [Ensifer adhaerens]